MSTKNGKWNQYDADCEQEDDGLTYPEAKSYGYGNNKETDKLVQSNGLSEDEVDIDLLLQRPNASCHQQFTDFSNVFKAFIGSALIGLPFAIRNAGIALGLIGIVLIAVATDHCCNLIVKCKRIVIQKMCQRMVAEGYIECHIDKQRQILGRTLSFGQIGRVSMGRIGTFLVDTSIVITQIGFCVGYFIFLGNTARSVVFEFLHYHSVGFTNTSNTLPVNVTNFTTTSLNSLQVTDNHFTVPLTTTKLITTELPEFVTIRKVGIMMNGTSNETQFASTNASLELALFNVTTIPPSNVTYINRKNSTGVFHKIISKIKSHLNTIKEKIVKMDNPITHKTLQENKAWTFALLLVVPAPLLILISFIRNLRKLGPVSVLANGSITGAFLATAIYILVGFKSPHETIVWFNFFKFPIFFGQVTGAFEGIGTVIPIEGSMAENRGRYPCYLHISLTLLSSILASFGTLGYLRYGNETNQIVTENLEGSAIVIALRCLLFFGVLFTYPLQIYPVIQIFEGLLFGPNSSCSRRLYRRHPSVNAEVADSSNGDANVEEDDDIIGHAIKIPTWQSNILRAALVLLTAVIGVIFRSQFAYIAALTGSIGSSLLSYILPCLFHIILQRRTMSKWIIAKDIALITLGVVGGIMGMTVTIIEITRTFGSHHKLHHH